MSTRFSITVVDARQVIIDTIDGEAIAELVTTPTIDGDQSAWLWSRSRKEVGLSVRRAIADALQRQGYR